MTAPIMVWTGGVDLKDLCTYLEGTKGLFFVIFYFFERESLKKQWDALEWHFL